LHVLVGSATVKGGLWCVVLRVARSNVDEVSLADGGGEDVGSLRGCVDISQENVWVVGGDGTGDGMC
jgi:hypothetical protein